MQVWVSIINGCTDGQVARRCDCSFSFVRVGGTYGGDRRVVQLSGAESGIRSTIAAFKQRGWFISACTAGGHPSPAEIQLVQELRGTACPVPSST